MWRIVILFFVFNVHAWDVRKNVLEKIKDYFKERYMNSLAADFSVLLNGGEFNTASKFKLPGFDLSLRSSLIKISKDNKIITESVGFEYLPLPFITAEIGLPLNFDLLIKGSRIYNISIYGAGLKYKVVKIGVPILGSLDLSIDSSGTFLSYENVDVKLQGYGINAGIIGSVTLNLLGMNMTPLVKIGAEKCQLNATLTKPTELKLSGRYPLNIRANVGININPLPLFYIYLGYGLSGVKDFYSIALGMKFGGLI